MVFGEISLSGDIRSVSRAEGRLKEALKLGFSSAITAQSAAENAPVQVRGYTTLVDAVTGLFPQTA